MIVLDLILRFASFIGFDLKMKDENLYNEYNLSFNSRVKRYI